MRRELSSVGTWAGLIQPFTITTMVSDVVVSVCIVKYTTTHRPTRPPPAHWHTHIHHTHTHTHTHICTHMHTHTQHEGVLFRFILDCTISSAIPQVPRRVPLMCPLKPPHSPHSLRGWNHLTTSHWSQATKSLWRIW